MDKQVYARLRTRAVQIGLEGEVLSNEETLYYSPIDANGAPAAWSAESYVLPLRLVAQQILSVVNAATVVERETRLTNVLINSPGFEQARKDVAASEATMVRDTDKGLRYLVKNEQGERVVKEGFDTGKLFAAGGVFYDDSLDYPLPLAGINYFSFDFKGTGKQLNVFFGGALLIANVAEPRLFGSRFDAGANIFVLAVPTTDTLYRDNREVNDRGRRAAHRHGGPQARPPPGQLRQAERRVRDPVSQLRRGGRHGGRLRAAERQPHPLARGVGELRPLGLPAGRGRQLQPAVEMGFLGTAGKPRLLRRKAGLPALGGAGEQELVPPLLPEGGARIRLLLGLGPRPVQQVPVRLLRRHPRPRLPGRTACGPTEVWAGHGSYGFEIGQAFRLEGIADAALATDEDTGLDRELLGGLGVQGTFIGPWQTVVNLDVGVPVAGPDDGFVLYVVFLKLFK